jgi:hypothetical protein
MNGRLEHLMYLAGLTAQGCWDKLDDYDRTAIEKFAELIVRECAEHLESSVLVPNSEHSRVKWKCIRAIKEHFGVEE